MPYFETRDVGMPLSDHLIDAATLGYLVIDLPAAGVPVFVPVPAGRGAAAAAVDYGGIGFDESADRKLRGGPDPKGVVPAVAFRLPV